MGSPFSSVSGLVEVSNFRKMRLLHILVIDSKQRHFFILTFCAECNSEVKSGQKWPKMAQRAFLAVFEHFSGTFWHFGPDPSHHAARGRDPKVEAQNL